MTIFRPLPTAAADSLPPVHAQVLAPETPAEKEVRLARQKNAKDSLIKSWHCCKTNSRPTYRSMQRIPVADGASGWCMRPIRAEVLNQETMTVTMGLKDEFNDAVQCERCGL
ncbi:hypothetical protein E4U57_004677 [Claviceps arundinis]|uniref:Uncharacterized protein n=1 Tax=Claviceps arundinis TaxID=1623583 RepID=A0A9P7SNB7_9HYPO|nr:hypothetical protein E4U57_004677 [Claviceps arundinis]KAG5961389.1 hypothetical protein E4U56_003915 [Claviceps arundinis]